MLIADHYFCGLSSFYSLLLLVSGWAFTFFTFFLFRFLASDRH